MHINLIEMFQIRLNWNLGKKTHIDPIEMLIEWS